MDMNQLSEKKGTKGHRFLMMTLYVVLALLFYWFLGFLMDDISDQPGPSLTEIQKKFQDPSFVKEKETYTLGQKKTLQLYRRATSTTNHITN